MNRRVICALVALAPARGYADGLVIVGGSPRAIGRAGAATVGDDGGGALLINPAAIARRDVLRVQLGFAMVEDELDWHGDAEGARTASGQAGSSAVPLGALLGAVGDWVLGAGAMTSSVFDRQLPRPGDVRIDTGLDPDRALKHNFDFRYAGIAGSYRRDTLVVGAARRVGDTLALGLSLALSQVHVTEHRRLWAGFDGVQPIGNANSDVDVELAAHTRFTPSAVAGLLYAPEDTPIELGASVGWAAAARLDGTLAATGVLGGPRVQLTEPSSTITVRQPLAVRVGGRYVGDRVVGELDGDFWIAPDGSDATTWRLAGLRVLDPTMTRMVDLTRLPSRISQHSHVALRTALDVQLVPGFLWATAGYAYANLGMPAARLSPSFGDLGGHTVGVGLEAMAGRVTVTLGWSRTWATATRAPTALLHDNPFDAGDGPVPDGTFDGSIDQVGLLIEASFAGQ